MGRDIDVKKMNDIILSLKRQVEELRELGSDIPALDRNLVRIRASLKMLEINICDTIEPNSLAE